MESDQLPTDSEVYLACLLKKLLSYKKRREIANEYKFFSMNHPSIYFPKISTKTINNQAIILGLNNLSEPIKSKLVVFNKKIIFRQ